MFTIREQGTDRGRTARKGAGSSVRGMVGVGSVVESQGGDARGRAELVRCWEAVHGPIVMLRPEQAGCLAEGAEE